MTDTLIKIEDLQRIDVRPGDRFVLRMDGPISMDLAQQLKKNWALFWGKEVPILIMEKGTELFVIRDEAA